MGYAIFVNKFDLTPFKSVLDIGCRQGSITAYLSDRYPKQKFTAIDNIAEEIEKAKSYQLSNVTFEVQNALYLGYTNQFDAVTSFSCLHWIQDKTKVLQNTYQALKPGGKAFFQFFAFHGRAKNDRFLYQTAGSFQWRSYFNHFSPSYFEITLTQLNTLLQNTGFVIHRIEVDRYKSQFSHPEELHQWFGTWASHQHRIPKAKQNHFLADTVSCYLKAHNYSEKSEFPYYEYLVEVICEKPSEPLINRDFSYRYGHITFTPHEAKVLKHFLQGKTAKEIGRVLSISPKTSEFHLANIKAKLNCRRRSEIYQAAIDYGFIFWAFDKET